MQPIIWYEQSAEDRIKATLWYAERNEEAARYHRGAGARWPSAQYHAERHEASAARLRALAAEMECTDKVLA